MRFLIVSLFFFSILLHAQISLAPGVKMPSVNAEWIKKPDLKSPIPQQKQILILNLVDVLSPDIYQTLRLIESVEKKYMLENRVAITAETVAKNDLSLVQKILKSDDNPFQLTIGVDNKGRTFKEFSPAVGSLPFTFIAVDGAIAWSGHPIEIETVVDSMIAGTFSLAKHKMVAQYRKNLQTALKAGLPDVVAQTADKILEISPNDSIAMQARLYAFELKGQSAEEAKFLQEHIKKNPKDSMRMRMLLLDLLLRQENTKAWTENLADAVAEAAKKPEDSLNLAAYLLDRTPMSILPVKEILKMAENAVANFKTSPRQNLYADALEIAAKANYAACRLNKAIEFQKEAVAVREKIQSPFLNRAKKTLLFFESLKTF